MSFTGPDIPDSRSEESRENTSGRHLTHLWIRFLLILLFLEALYCKSAQDETPITQKAEIKNILLITVDTLRADALSIYGNPERTPFLERLAGQSMVFENAFTCVPITLPAHTSLLTGLYPPVHGVRNNGTYRAASDLTLLSEIAQRHGLKTAAVIGGFPLDGRYGLNQGFDSYDDRLGRPDSPPGVFAYAERDAEIVRRNAEEWLLSHVHDPFFLWIHFFDPHHPYLDHGYGLSSLYQQEVLHVDEELSKLFDVLKSKGLEKNTLIVFTADHGEAFGEHQEISHSLFLYNTTLRIPLLISIPGEEPGRQQSLVRIIDIFPTVLDIFQWKSTPTDGVSLLPFWKDPNLRMDLQNYSETLAPAIDFGWSPLFAIQTLEGKFIEAPTPEYYSIQDDPGETQNRVDTVDPGPFRASIESIRSRIPQGVEPHVPTPEEREKLQSLGYMTGSPVRIPINRIDPKDKIQVARRIAELTMSPMRIEQKARAYAEIAKEESNNPLLLLRYAEILLALNRYSEAEKVFQQVLRLEYPSASVYNGLAAAYFHRNRMDQAKQILEEAVRRNVGDGETYHNLAEFYMNENQPQKALPMYEKSMDLGFLSSFFRKAEWEETSGNLTNALSILQRAEMRFPGEGEVNFRQGLLYLQFKQDEMARKYFEQAWKKGVRNPQIRELIQKLGGNQTGG